MNRLDRRKLRGCALGVLAVLALGAAGTAAAQSAPGKQPPNIVVILTDDQGWCDTSFPMDPGEQNSGSKYLSTPNIKRLAEQGMTFTNGYAPAPMCTPTRRSIQFGMSPARMRGAEWVSRNFQPQGHLSLAQTIKQNNPAYRCAHFGKWGEVLWGKRDDDIRPELIGYDVSDGTTGNVTGTCYSAKESDKNYELTATDDPKLVFSVTDRAVDFMKKQVEEKHPFYLQVSYYAIHLAIQARQQTFDKYKAKGLPDRKIPDGLGAMLEDLDDGVGRLLKAIDDLGIAGDTYVFFFSDNGGAPIHFAGAAHKDDENLPDRNFPLRAAKQWVYEGGVRVPFIVRGPGVKPGSTCATPVVEYDLLPTAHELAGAKFPLASTIDGGSLLPLLHNGGKGEVQRANSPGLIFHRPAYQRGQSSFRSGDYKLVVQWKGAGWDPQKVSLYNLKDDISESQDLAKQMPDKAKEMYGTLMKYFQDVNAEEPMIKPNQKNKPAPKDDEA